MSTTEFAARVRPENGEAVVELSGQISAGAEAGLQQAYAEVSGEPKVLLDFSGVEYINSTGIALIVGILAEARKNGQELQATGLAEQYREMFRMTRLGEFVTIMDYGGAR